MQSELCGKWDILIKVRLIYLDFQSNCPITSLALLGQVDASVDEFDLLVLPDFNPKAKF